MTIASFIPMADFIAANPPSQESSRVGLGPTTYTQISANYTTRVLAEAASFSADVLYLNLVGYTHIGDNGGGLFARCSVNPTFPAALWQFQSADGTWWSYCEDIISPETCGAKGDGVTDDAAAVQAAIRYAEAVGTATEGAAGAVIGRQGSKYAIGSTLTTVVPIKFHVPYLLYLPTTGSCIVFGNAKSYRNWGYDIKIGTIRSANGNTTLPTAVNNAGTDGVVFRCIQFSYIEIGMIIAFSRYNIFMDSTNTGVATLTTNGQEFFNSCTGAVSISATDSSNTLTLVGANFGAMDAGKDITIPGAGPSGTSLKTWIASVIDATHITLVPAVPGGFAATTTLVGVTETIAWSGGQQNQQNSYKFGQVAYGGIGYFEDSVSAATGAVNDCLVYIQDSFANAGNFNLNNGNDNDNIYVVNLDAPSQPAVDAGNGYCASINGSYNQITAGYVNGLFAFQGGAVENDLIIGNNANTGVVIGYGGLLNEIKCSGNTDLPLLVAVSDNATVQNQYGVPIIVYLSFEITPGSAGTGNTQVELDLQDARAAYPTGGAYPVAQYLTTAAVNPVTTFGTISVIVPAGWWWKAKKTLSTGVGAGTVNYLYAWIMEAP